MDLMDLILWDIRDGGIGGKEPNSDSWSICKFVGWGVAAVLIV